MRRGIFCELHGGVTIEIRQRHSGIRICFCPILDYVKCFIQGAAGRDGPPGSPGERGENGEPGPMGYSGFEGYRVSTSGCRCYQGHLLHFLKFHFHYKTT